MHTVKCVVVGDSGVGKTCLLIAYTSNSFPEDYIPTTFELFCANLMIQSKSVRIDLWDTRGHEEYDRLRPISYSDTDVFLLCFSVVSVVTFDHIRTKWIDEVRRHSPTSKVFLVGTKTDLRNDPATLERLKDEKVDCVTLEKGQELARELGVCGYVEVSARTQSGVKDVFEKAATAVLCPSASPSTPASSDDVSCVVS